MRVEAPPKIVSAFLDESGALRATKAFFAGIWFTPHPDLWRTIIRERREKERLGYELHFCKISNQKSDWRARVIEEIFYKMAGLKHSWWSRLIYVPDSSVSFFKTMTITEVYDHILTALALQFCPRAYADQVNLFIDQKSRPANNNFLPDGLENLLNSKGPRNIPEFTVALKDSKTDDLLQLSDLITSSVRQSYVPSENLNKRYLASILEPLIGDRIKIWECDFK